MISKRLIECAKFTKGFNVLADIGCDHAYLPIFAITNNYVNFAYCYDINIGPVNKAIENITKSKLDDKISAYVADGLDKLNNDVDVISICGMGGILMYNILKKDINKLNNVKRLILEPNCDSDYVRKITNFGFKIIHEVIINDKSHSYEIIVLEKGNQILTPLQIKYGPILLEKKPNEFIEKYQKKLNLLKNNYCKINDIINKEAVKIEIDELEKVIK